MGPVCMRCASPLANGRFCPSCGAEQPADSRERDPYVGRIIGDRYEVGELISVGGMGRVHRGLQRSLERAVAIKFIHPHLLTSPNAVNRFMTEARAASRLNHPNVVSVFDFGRTTDADGADLFIVMELLAGADLANVLRRTRALPVPRVAELLRQTLAALAEAHAMGITHRDVKPENIVLERFRGDVDHVKVIDFGIASVAGRKRITQAGQLMGTPGYMAPEQVMGDAGPSSDLYAVGVILFELLTGRLPFDDTSAQKVFHMHLSAPRPDPRAVAPGRKIPAALAEVCLRALEVDPARRFPDADALADAIVAAAAPGAAGSARARRQRFTPEDESRSSKALADAETLADGAAHGVPSPPDGSAGLVGRGEDLAWAREQLEGGRGVAGVALWGDAGVGRTRLAREVTAALARRGWCALPAEIPPAPHREVGFSGLRRVVALLAGRGADDRALATGAGADEPNAATGLRAIFGREHPRALGDPEHVADGAAAALRWAARTAVARAEGARVLLVLDDADAMDRASLAALRAFVRAEPVARLALLLTSERAPDPALRERLPARRLAGLSHAEAARLWGDAGASQRWPQAAGVEPLYVEQLRRWRGPGGDALLPPTLAELIEQRVQALAPEQRRTLQAIALAGGTTTERLARMLPNPEELAAGLRPLADAGLAELRDRGVALSHAVIGQAVLKMSPDGAVAELHVAAADALLDAPECLELRAFHAIRGRADFEAFVLVEEAARLRAARGDDEGAIAVLYDAVHAARTQLARGDGEFAQSGCAVFGSKLAAALIAVGRVEEAHGVLSEVLDFAGQRDLSRALILEQLAMVAAYRGREPEAHRRWAEARAIAEHRADRALVERLRRPVPPLAMRAPPPRLFPQSAP